MGERTWVNLTFPAGHEAKVTEIAKATYNRPSSSCSSCGLVTFGFEEVNYGELPPEFLQAMRDNGIAYDMDWFAGGEFIAGTWSLRFNADGEAQQLSFTTAQVGVPLSTLLANINDHEKLKAAIREHEANTVAWSWENQDTYGKRYRARQLITPNTEL